MKTKTVFVNQKGHLSQTCGVTELGWFRDHKAVYGEEPESVKNLTIPSGAGWFIAGFTDKLPIYKEAYNQLAAKYKIVYQSPVRINTRTNRKFFFCIFDAKTQPN